MERFLQHSGRHVVMMIDNVNTDQIIPSREMKRVSKKGLAEGLFANTRYLDAASGGRTPDPDFVLNKKETKGASILISSKNFGCGSSREHAVWALVEYGFKVIMAESFGSIFFDNCIANGVLPITLSSEALETLAKEDGSLVDLVNGEVRAGKYSLSFEIDHAKRKALMDGHSAIDLTLKKRKKIEEHISRDHELRPWIYQIACE